MEYPSELSSGENLLAFFCGFGLEKLAEIFLHQWAFETQLSCKHWIMYFRNQHTVGWGDQAETFVI